MTLRNSVPSCCRILITELVGFNTLHHCLGGIAHMIYKTVAHRVPPQSDRPDEVLSLSRWSSRMSARTLSISARVCRRRPMLNACSGFIASHSEPAAPPVEREYTHRMCLVQLCSALVISVSWPMTCSQVQSKGSCVTCQRFSGNVATCAPGPTTKPGAMEWRTVND